MSALSDFVRILVKKPPTTGAVSTYGIVTAVNVGPPATYDVLRSGTPIPGIRRTVMSTAPVVDDRVLMLEQDGTVVIIGVMND